jgi:hypothetical protein
VRKLRLDVNQIQSGTDEHHDFDDPQREQRRTMPSAQQDDADAFDHRDDQMRRQLGRRK